MLETLSGNKLDYLAYIFHNAKPEGEEKRKKNFSKNIYSITAGKIGSQFFYQKIIGRLYKMTCYSLLTLKLIDLESI